MGGNDFTKAQKLFRKKKYSDVIRLLEPQVFKFRENFKFYHFLGLSCLHTGDTGGAYSYLRRGIDLNHGDIDTLLGLAVVHLKRHETAEAIRIWFQVIDKDPSNQYASRGLKIVQKIDDTIELTSLTEGGKLKKLIPVRRNILRSFKYLIIILFAIAVIMSIPLLINRIQETRVVARPEINAVVIEDENFVLNYSGEFKFILTEKEIIETFDRAKQYFQEYKDNLALRELNRLFYSNSSNSVKEKAEVLKGYIKTPTFTTMKDSFTLTEVRLEPQLYNNCYVKWKGRASNIVITEDIIRFDFLVGSDIKYIEGIIPAQMNFAAKLDHNNLIEVIAEIMIIDESIEIIIHAIHNLGPDS